MSFDNTISTPLFQQLAATLRAAIDAGEYPPGSRLPTENELCERYSVSRVTVRKALDELSQGEFLVRKPGKGTFVAEKKIQRKLDGVLSYTNMCYMMGYQPGAKTIKITLEQPTEEERGAAWAEKGRTDAGCGASAPCGRQTDAVGDQQISGELFLSVQCRSDQYLSV